MIEAGPANLDHEGIGQAALLKHGVDNASHDPDVEIEPPLRVERLEPGELDSCGQPTDKVEERTLKLAGQGAIALGGGL